MSQKNFFDKIGDKKKFCCSKRTCLSFFFNFIPYTQMPWNPSGVGKGAENLPSSSKSGLRTTKYVMVFSWLVPKHTKTRTPSSSSVEPGLWTKTCIFPALKLSSWDNNHYGDLTE